jgi:hypothetical protein
MKGKMLYVVVLILLFFGTIRAGGIFHKSLAELKQTVNGHPHIIVRPNGGFFAIWYEAERISPDMYVYEYKTFYQVLDEHGRTLIPKTELKFWKGDYGVPSFDENSILFLDRERVLIIARQSENMLSNPPSSHLQKLVINLSDGSVKRDSIGISFQKCSIVRDNAGNVYAAEVGYAWQHYARIIQVHPHFGTVKKMIVRYPREKFMKHYLDSEDNVITVTSRNEFLIAGRVWSVDGRKRLNRMRLI